MSRPVKIIFWCLIAGVVFTVGVFIFMGSRPETQNIYKQSHDKYVRIGFGGIFIDAEVVSTSEKRMLGLSGREGLADNSGMLFIFAEPAEYGIWMKDMFFPIDIIWFNENFESVHIAEDISPETYPEVFYPTKPAKYVLEVIAGAVEKSGISVGDRIEIFGNI